MKKCISIILCTVILLSFSACGEKTYAFSDIAKLPEGGDSAVVELLGEGDAIYENDGTTLFAREYKLKTLGKKCSVSFIYNNGNMTQIALYFNDRASTFSALENELWTLYGDSDHKVDADNGVTGQIWMLESGDAVYLKKSEDGTNRVTVECARDKETISNA